MRSPLRYPGGKTRAVKILRAYVNRFYHGRTTLLSPFLGGGSFELAMLDDGYKLIANDLFVPLVTFWNSDHAQVAQVVRAHMPVSKERFRELRNNITTMEPVEQAAAYFVINRCSFSGATFCGGFSAQASDGRLNEAAVKRLEQTPRLAISNMDCCAFLDANPESRDALVYADPPYYITNYMYGKDGDLHESFDHEALARKLLQRRDWILSYNDCEYIRNLYRGCRIFEENWSYGMNASKQSSEVIILPPV